jgi:hypothetical protein
VTRRRRFEPAGLVSGVVFLAIAAAYGCDVAGVWHPDPALVPPVVGFGLLLTAVTAVATRSVRRRRRSVPPR